MKNFSNSKNYKNAQVYSGNGGQIPVGGYVCKIMDVKYATYDWGDRIEMAFDIDDGEYAGFFKKKYDADQSEDKKWKGVFRLNVPKDDGSEQDGWTMSKFKTTMDNFERSNSGFTWDWDESKLKGKKIGIIFRTRHTTINGRSVTFSEANRSAAVEDIESGNYKIPDDYYDNKYQGESANSGSSNGDDFMGIDHGAPEEIPF